MASLINKDMKLKGTEFEDNVASSFDFVFQLHMCYVCHIEENKRYLTSVSDLFHLVLCFQELSIFLQMIQFHPFMSQCFTMYT